MKRYFIDSNGNIRESASEQFLMHSTGKWDRDKTKYVKIVKSPSGRPAYLYPDDLLPGKKYGPKVGEKAENKEEEKNEPTDEERYGKGNIDLLDRPVFKNEDGSISTVDSFSTNIDGEEVLLPTIGRDKDGNPIRLTEDEAVEKYMKDGKHLGKFKTPEEATAYAQKLHEDQEKLYADKDEGVKTNNNGKYAVISGGHDYRVDSVKDALRIAKGEKPRSEEKNETKTERSSTSSSSSTRSGKSSASSGKSGITLADIEAARQQIKSGILDEKGKLKQEKTSGSSKKSSSKKSSSNSSTKTESSSKSNSNSNSSEKEEKKEKAALNSLRNKLSNIKSKAESRSSSHIDLSSDTTSSNVAGVTRRFFGNSENRSNQIKPANLKAKPGATSGRDTAKGSSNNAPANRPRGHERQFDFEKKSKSKTWHVKEGTVKKDKALGTHRKTGKKNLDEFLKQLK